MNKKTKNKLEIKDNFKYTYTLPHIASMKATFNETICNAKSCFWLPTLPTIIISWGPSLTQMPAPHHIHLTCMLRMAEMTVIVFYRVTMDKVIRTPRITHLWQSLGVVMLFTLPNVSSRDSLKRFMSSPDEVVLHCLSVMLTIVSVLP